MMNAVLKYCIKIIPFVLIGAVFLSGCKHQKSEPEEERKDSKKMYRFVDAAGEEHEAKLLESVPKCDYDYSRLSDEDGYKYYTDKKGVHISKIGIDVSEYQGKIDWRQVKGAGIEFAVIRLGFRGYGGEGKLVLDAMYEENIQGAIEAGVDVGVYFFSQAVSEEEALEEAKFVIQHVKNYEVTYPVVFDTEEIKDDTARTDGLTTEQFTQNCITFCDAVRKAGYDAMIYANMKWMAYTLDLEKLVDYRKWYADYEPVPQCPYEFDMWQYTESGTIPGIEGNVDMNLLFDGGGNR